MKTALQRLGGPDNTPSVLVVDDDPGTLELMVATLQTLGIAARTAASGTQALEMIEQQPPDALILDLVMPGLNGFDLLHALRRQMRFKHLPVFVWTSMQLQAHELAVLKASAQRGGGQIRRRARHAGGAAARLAGPSRARGGHMSASAAPKRSSEARSAEGGQMSIPRILIVDDNEMNVEMASFLLTRAGMEVTSVLDGHGALDTVASFQPDLVLMDMQLPGFDGMALTRELRSRPPARPLAIVAFTAYAMMGDKERFLAVGCNGYIAKPIQVATFADEVRALLPQG